MLLKLGPCPADRLFCADIESVRIEQCALVVIAQQHEAAPIPDDVHALAWIWPVANDVAQAKDGIHMLLVDILQHGAERLKIPVHVTDDGPLHWHQTRSAGPCRTMDTAWSVRTAQTTVKRCCHSLPPAAASAPT